MLCGLLSTQIGKVVIVSLIWQALTTQLSGCTIVRCLGVFVLQESHKDDRR